MNKKVLLINNVTARPIITELLTGAGYGVDVVSDSDAGMQYLDNQACDAVIVWESPAVESWRLCQKIRNLTAIPLIIISSNASTESCVRAINAGADYFMRKPFGPLEFLARVNSLMQRAPLRQTVTVGS
jgi:two-component system response regulator VanR